MISSLMIYFCHSIAGSQYGSVEKIHRIERKSNVRE